MSIKNYFASTKRKDISNNDDDNLKPSPSPSPNKKQRNNTPIKNSDESKENKDTITISLSSASNTTTISSSKLNDFSKNLATALGSKTTMTPKTTIATSSSSSSLSLSSSWIPFDETMEPSWKTQLVGETKKPYFKRLSDFLNNESKSNIIYPPREQIFSAFSFCPFDKVNVVIIGQDPYHGPGQAHGLAFSVQKGIQSPPSLMNMIKEATVYNY